MSKFKCARLIILTIVLLMILCISASARVINFTGGFSKSIDKADSQWMGLTDPTVLSTETDGSIYIIWAVDDKEKDPNVPYYETTAYRIHTIPAGSENKIGLEGTATAERNKLKDSYTKYGNISGKMVTIPVNGSSTRGSKFATSGNNAIKINGSDYWFRLLKLSKGDVDYLLPGGYTNGTKLYFSGIMKNNMPGYSPNVRSGLETYIDWVAEGDHNLVFSNRVRGGVSISNSGGGKPTVSQLATIISKVGIDYVTFINNHYNRVITFNKMEVKDKYNVQVQVFIDGKEATSKRVSAKNIDDTTEVKAIDEDGKIKLIVGGLEVGNTKSPQEDGCTIDKTTYDTGAAWAEYTIGESVNDSSYQKYNFSIKKIDKKSISFRFYYKTDEAPPSDDPGNNNVTIHYIKAGGNYNSEEDELLPDKIINSVVKGSPQSESVSPELTKDGDLYEYITGKTYYNGVIYGSNTNSQNPYTYVVNAVQGASTDIVIEYKQKITITDEANIEPYEDKDISANAKGSILSSAYNVFYGIPSSKNITTEIISKGYLYRVQGKKVTGNRIHEVTLVAPEKNAEGEITGIKTRKEQILKDFQYFAIEKYEIYKLEEGVIENEVYTNGLTSQGNTLKFNGHDLTVTPSLNGIDSPIVETNWRDDYDTRIMQNTFYNETMLGDVKATINNLVSADPSVSSSKYLWVCLGDIDDSNYAKKQAENARLLIPEPISDSITIKDNSNSETSCINPKMLTRLNYNSDDIIDDSAGSDSSEEHLSWLQKLWSGIVKVVETIVNAIKTAWNAIMEFFFGSNGSDPVLEADVSEYNDAVDVANSMSRIIFNEKFSKELNIEKTKLNKIYPTDTSIVKYTHCAGDSGFIAGVEGFSDIQNIKGKVSESDLIYMADKVNSVQVHTPIYIEAKIEGGPTSAQNINSPAGTATTVIVGQTYNFKIYCNGSHKQSKIFSARGYGFNDYKEFIKDGSIMVKFPYDIEIRDSGVTKVFKKDEWNKINSSTIEITIPTWAEMEGDGIVYYEVKASAINEADGYEDDLELGRENANYDPNDLFAIETYEQMPYDYRAHAYSSIYAVGKIYDFRVSFTNDYEYRNTATGGGMKYQNSSDEDNGLLIKDLPFGQKGDNTYNMQYTKAPKLGSKFKFNLKTLGWKTDSITILPTFYYIDKTNGASKKVTPYYLIEPEKLVEVKDSTTTYKLETQLKGGISKVKVNNKDYNIPESTITDRQVVATTKVQQAYNLGQLDKFKPLTLSYVYTNKTNIGNIAKVKLDESTRIRQIDNNINESATHSLWYGEYKLPSTSVFKDLSSGKILTNKAPNTGEIKVNDGYILVCFNVIGNYNDSGYLNYQKSYLTSGTQWEEEQWQNTIELLSGTNATNMPNNPTQAVGVFLYEAFENNGEDIVGTH